MARSDPSKFTEKQVADEKALRSGKAKLPPGKDQGDMMGQANRPGALIEFPKPTGPVEPSLDEALDKSMAPAKVPMAGGSKSPPSGKATGAIPTTAGGNIAEEMALRGAKNGTDQPTASDSDLTTLVRALGLTATGATVLYHMTRQGAPIEEAVTAAKEADLLALPKPQEMLALPPPASQAGQPAPDVINAGPPAPDVIVDEATAAAVGNDPIAAAPIAEKPRVRVPAGSQPTPMPEQLPVDEGYNGALNQRIMEILSGADEAVAANSDTFAPELTEKPRVRMPAGSRPTPSAVDQMMEEVLSQDKPKVRVPAKTRVTPRM